MLEWGVSLTCAVFLGKDAELSADFVEAEFDRFGLVAADDDDAEARSIRFAIPIFVGGGFGGFIQDFSVEVDHKALGGIERSAADFGIARIESRVGCAVEVG